jgi:molybdenum cofactor cytidylyltransferase
LTGAAASIDDRAVSASPPIEAVVLAAGSSARLGMPKALVEIGGRTVLERILAELEGAGVRAGVVVGGEHLGAMKARVDAAPFRYAWNPSPEAGRMGSIVIGLASTEPESDVLLWPVDRPMAKGETVRALRVARERETSQDAVLVPQGEGRRGHPILIGWGLRGALMAAAPDANLREVLVRCGAKRVEVDVRDPGIHEELDTPEDAERLKSGAT